LTFNLLTSGSVHAEVLPWNIMSTDFGADSSSRFPFRAQTNRHTDRQTRLNARPHAGVGNNVYIIRIISYNARNGNQTMTVII